MCAKGSGTLVSLNESYMHMTKTAGINKPHATPFARRSESIINWTKCKSVKISNKISDLYLFIRYSIHCSIYFIQNAFYVRNLLLGIEDKLGSNSNSTVTKDWKDMVSELSPPVDPSWARRPHSPVVQVSWRPRLTAPHWHILVTRHNWRVQRWLGVTIPGCQRAKGWWDGESSRMTRWRNEGWGMSPVRALWHPSTSNMNDYPKSTDTCFKPLPKQGNAKLGGGQEKRQRLVNHLIPPQCRCFNSIQK